MMGFHSQKCCYLQWKYCLGLVLEPFQQLNGQKEHHRNSADIRKEDIGVRKIGTINANPYELMSSLMD